ncbi:MAG: transglutaminase domain-containing protein [Gemmatimonadota bacterium]|nr:transglutaminase domain-containing protein [Gemmatimonadota bacterium]
MSALKKTIYVLISAVVLTLVAMAAIALIYVRGDTFHPASWKRTAVLTSKRLAGELGALAYAIRDPYARSHIYAPLGPGDTAADGKPSPSFSSVDKLQDFFNGSDSYSGMSVKFFSNAGLPQGRFPFYYQTAAEPRLDSLVSLYPIANAFENTSSDYEGLTRINRWLHDYFHTDRHRQSLIPKVDYNFNALDILHRAGLEERFWCSEYSTTLVQCLAALGYTTRYVMLNSETGGHVLCEAWSDTYGKWVMLDPYFCRRVMLDEVPLDVYEIHRLEADRQSRTSAVIFQKGEILAAGEERKFYLSLFRNFAVRMRNDWFTNRYPHLYPLSNSVMNAVEWQDELTDDNIYYRNETSSLEELYWPLNGVKISVHPAREPGTLELYLETVTPNFSHFLAGSDYPCVQRIESSHYTWRLRPGLNIFRATAVNSLGIEGSLSSLGIEWGKK